MALKRTAATLWFLISLAAPTVGTSVSSPLAHWVRLDPNGTMYTKLLSAQKDQCLPDTASTTFPIPGFVQILFVAWKNERPKCTIQDQSVGDPVEAIVLLTREPIDNVKTWYREKMEGTGYREYTIHAGQQKECTGKEPVDNPITVFSKVQVSEFCWNRDYPRRPAIVITQARNVFQSHGYKTTIELSQMSERADR